MSKLQAKLGLFLVIAWVLFALIDMWFDIVTLASFIKISISVSVLFLLFLLLGVFFSANQQNSKRDD